MGGVTKSQDPTGWLRPRPPPPRPTLQKKYVFNGGVKSCLKKCFGPKIIPQGPFWVGIRPFGLRNAKESESGPQKKSKKHQKLEKHFSYNCFETYPPHWGRSLSVPLQEAPRLTPRDWSRRDLLLRVQVPDSEVRSNW